MVQIIKGGSEKRQADERMGYTVGKNISDMLMNFGANKALDGVLNDESLKDAPVSERLSKLQQALMPYGDKGMEVLQTRFQIEQQAQQEKMMQEKKKQDLVMKKEAEQNQQRLFQHQKELQTMKNEGKSAPGGVGAQPIPPEIAQRIPQILNENKNANADELAEAFDLAGVPSFYSNKYVENRRRGDETNAANIREDKKLEKKEEIRQDANFDKSYDAQKDFIDKTTKSYQSFETEMKPKLLQMQSIPDENIISPTQAVFLESLGIPLGALENPGSELYDKLSQDLMKGLPEVYGSKIMKVEVENFLKTIPRLVNSPDGRRMIASNMLKLGEMKEVYYNEMRRQQMDHLDESKNFPKDFQQRVFDQVKPQIDRINNEFVKMSAITSVPKGTIPFFSPSGNIEFVPEKDAEWATKNGGRRVW